MVKFLSEKNLKFIDPEFPPTDVRGVGDYPEGQCVRVRPGPHGAGHADPVAAAERVLPAEGREQEAGDLLRADRAERHQARGAGELLVLVGAVVAGGTASAGEEAVREPAGELHVHLPGEDLQERGVAVRDHRRPLPVLPAGKGVECYHDSRRPSSRRLTATRSGSSCWRRHMPSCTAATSPCATGTPARR